MQHCIQNNYNENTTHGNRIVNRGTLYTNMTNDHFDNSSNSVAESNNGAHTVRTGPKVMKIFLCLTQLSLVIFIMLINVKMPTIVRILTFFSMINTSSDSLKAREVFFNFVVFTSS